MASPKEFLEYLFSRFKDTRPVTHVVNNVPYAVNADGTLGLPVRELAPQWTAPTLEATSLDGLIAAYNAGIDGFSGKVGLHVVNPRQVELLSLAADGFGHRHVWVRAKHQAECPFRFDTYYESEAFLLAFRTSFLYEENAVKVQRLVSTLSANSSVHISDDGMSQNVTVQDGAVTRANVELPPEIPLAPWRTFREVNPVISKFMLRLKSVKDSVPHVALFEVDARWRLDTIASVAAYLGNALPKVTILV